MLLAYILKKTLRKKWEQEWTDTDTMADVFSSYQIDNCKDFEQGLRVLNR